MLKCLEWRVFMKASRLMAMTMRLLSSETDAPRRPQSIFRLQSSAPPVLSGAPTVHQATR